MSRTDHHRPYWVRRRDPLERGYRVRHDHLPYYVLCVTGEKTVERRYHYFPMGERTVTSTVRTGYTKRYDVECDVDQYLDGHFHDHWNAYHCGSSLTWADRPYSHVPREATHLDYYRPMRRQGRDTLRLAARDYNTYGETEIEPDSPQHRHRTSWWYY